MARTTAKLTSRRSMHDVAASSDRRVSLSAAFQAVRAETERRAALLSPEDQVVQSMADASPTKWHRAHVTWFFETFLLQPKLVDYQIYDERFPFLFNSYYVQAGPRHARPKRGLITRPTVAEVADYRAHVDEAVQRLIETAPDDQLGEIGAILEIGLNHEQQHQELLYTDILHAFAQNPTHPVYDEAWQPAVIHDRTDFVQLPTGLHLIGHDGQGFSFDNESPRHQELVQEVAIARGLVTNGEWLEFMADGGYRTPTLWLADGWSTVDVEGWDAPGYWQQVDGVWHQMTLGGLKPIDPSAPVCHISYYEADAFANWRGKHLPTEAEWEVAARSGLIDDAFGMVWQWTRSHYSPYPGYRPPEGAIGEYNGKFMISQMVLRGSSQATPEGHSRLTYRNFFYPPSRWQFTGVRLSDYDL